MEGRVRDGRGSYMCVLDRTIPAVSEIASRSLHSEKEAS